MGNNSQHLQGSRTERPLTHRVYVTLAQGAKETILALAGDVTCLVTHAAGAVAGAPGAKHQPKVLGAAARAGALIAGPACSAPQQYQGSGRGWLAQSADQQSGLAGHGDTKVGAGGSEAPFKLTVW
jgi:hypothetical protein